MRTRIILALTAIALFAAAPLAVAAPVPPTTTPPTPPSVVELCAATGVEQVDALLDGLADTDLVGDLAPLLDITVPRDDGLTLDVELDRLREALDCQVIPTTPPTVEPTVEPTLPAPTTTPDSTDDPDDDFDQVGTPPSGGVATGTR